MSKATAKEHFFRLISENKGIIIRICNSYCPDKSFREDLAQEIIYQLWKSGDHYDPNQKFSTWMYQVALNVAISFYRKQKKSIEQVPLDALPQEPADANPATEVEIRIAALQKAIQSLGELDKALMILFLEKKTYAEMGEILGISETNVATRLYRTKKKIKQYFSDLNS